MFSVYAGESSNVRLALACDDANVLLQKIGEFFHELAAGSRGHFGYVRSASRTRYIIFGPIRPDEP